jgi:peroxin-2
VLEPEVKSPAPKTVVFADDVKGPSDEEDGRDEDTSQILGEEDDDMSSENLRPQTPSVASDQADNSAGSESEDYEAEEDELGEGMDR